jgi:hypothetical protein
MKIDSFLPKVSLLLQSLYVIELYRSHSVEKATTAKESKSCKQDGSATLAKVLPLVAVRVMNRANSWSYGLNSGRALPWNLYLERYSRLQVY